MMMMRKADHRNDDDDSEPFGGRRSSTPVAARGGGSGTTEDRSVLPRDGGRRRRRHRIRRGAVRLVFGGTTLPLSPVVAALLLLLLLVTLLLPRDASVAVAAAKVDAETGGECIDADPANCPFWAATGECQTNRGYMHVHCKKSCDRCNVVRVKDRNEINRYMEAKQKEIEEKRRVRKLEKEALEVLKTGGGGGFGAVGDGGHDRDVGEVVSETKNTEDVVVIGSDGGIERSSEAEATAETVVAEPKNPRPANPESDGDGDGEMKKKTKTTTTTVDAREECVDLDDNCPELAAKGKCETNRNVMSRICRSSCDLCEDEDGEDAAAAAANTAVVKPNKPQQHATAESNSGGGGVKTEKTKKKTAKKIDAETGSECVDLDDNCPLWAATGECRTNRSFMSRNCRLSCDRCHIVRVNSQREMQSYIARKTQETEHERAARKQAREVQKILSGGEL